MFVMLILLSSHASLFLWWIGIVGWVSEPSVICSLTGGGFIIINIRRQTENRPLQNTLSRLQKTDSGLLMHYRPYS